MRYLRNSFIWAALATLAAATGCTYLTEVDWTRVPTESVGGDSGAGKDGDAIGGTRSSPGDVSNAGAQ